MKAKEVLDKLGITRQTLTKYVKQGLIKVDGIVNSRYIYNDESVNNLGSNVAAVSTISKQELCLTTPTVEALEDIYNIFELFVKMRLLTGGSLEYVVDLKKQIDQIKLNINNR